MNEIRRIVVVLRTNAGCVGAGKILCVAVEYNMLGRMAVRFRFIDKLLEIAGPATESDAAAGAQ